MTQATFADNANDPQASSEAQASATTQATESDQDKVALIVGERAFKTIDDVKTKIVNQDEHISKIEEENARLREEAQAIKDELENRSSVEETLRSKDASVLSEDKIAELINNRLSEADQQKAVQENIANCMDNAKARLGENFINDINKTATELGLSIAQVDQMAGSNPALFERTFLPEAKQQSVQHSQRSTVRTANFNDTPQPNPLDKPVMQMTPKERVAAVMQALENAKSN